MPSEIDSNSNIINEISSNEEKDEKPLLMDTNNEDELIKIEKTDIPFKTEMENEPDGQPIILEGKRSRKPTIRLDLSEAVPAKKGFTIPQGHGTPLGEIEYISYRIAHASTDALSRMRNICFGRRGNKITIRKHLREFKGFEFDPNSTEYQKHLSNLIKFRKDELRSISNILGLPLTGRNIDHAERILNFLIKPMDEGRKISGKKSSVRKSKKRSTHSKELADTDPEIKQQNGNDEHGADYNFKPGKKSSNKRKTDPSESKENQADHSIINTDVSTNNLVEDLI